MDIIDEKFGIALIKLSTGDCYTVALERDAGGVARQVFSVVPGDMPPDRGRFMAPATDAGVRYVANPRKRANARRWFRWLTGEAAEQEALTNIPPDPDPEPEVDHDADMQRIVGYCDAYMSRNTDSTTPSGLKKFDAFSRAVKRHDALLRRTAKYLNLDGSDEDLMPPRTLRVCASYLLSN